MSFRFLSRSGRHKSVVLAATGRGPTVNIAGLAGRVEYRSDENPDPADLSEVLPAETGPPLQQSHLRSGVLPEV